jgi:riboflavin kinase/FMN adenylyltransferase
MFEIKLKNNFYNNTDVVATIGNFDGIHLGHQELFKQMVTFAQSHKVKSVVITFEPLPKEFIEADNNLLRLSLLRDKYNIVKTFAIDSLVVMRFNSQLQKLAAKDFVQDILIKQLKIKYLFVGNDFRFGYQALGNIKLLQDLGINVVQSPEYKINNSRVSSSLIRSYAKDNKFTAVKLLLGRNIMYTSRVVYGNQLGRKYGVPTINLLLVNKVPILWGIYFAYVYIDNIRYNAVVSCGQNPTVTTTKNYKLEAHLLDVDLNLYGKIATIEILDFSRAELKFESLEQLFEQIHQDLQNARNYFYRLNSHGI